MTIDEKDLEIARLKGKIEALEGELAKERLARTPLQIPCVPQIQPLQPYTNPRPWYEPSWPVESWEITCTNSGL